MALTAAEFVLAGSGLLYAALGVAVCLLARGHRPALALGIGLAAFGASFIVANLVADAGAIVELNTGFYLAAAAGLATSAISYGRRSGRGMWWLLALALPAAVISAFAALFLPDGFLLTFFPRDVLDGARIDQAAFAVLYVAIALLVLAAALCAREADGRRARGFALLSIALASYSTLNGASSMAGDPLSFSLSTLVTFGLPLALVLAGAMTWTIWARPERARLGRNVALIISAFALLGALYPFWGFSSAIGIVRIMGAGCVGIAIFQCDLLGVKLPRLVVARGPATAAALALLFIVAQIAQNFLAAQYGLLMGGVVAGAFLFAAAPLQRAMERMGAQREREHMPQAPPRSVASDSDDDIYRRALRLALRDKLLTRAEELDLHRFATRLGITGERAHEILIEVERETEAPR